MSLSYQDAYKITGSRSEAEILRRISFWQPKATIKHNGEYWIIKTAKEFIDEGVPYSEITIKRAMKALRKKELIEVFHSYHPFKTGPHCSWIRLLKSDEELLSLIGKGDIKVPLKGSS